MSFLTRLKRKLIDSEKRQLTNYYKRFCKHAFKDKRCYSYEQFEGSITRLYHTVEKGLAYNDYRPGFGKENINTLITSMEIYARKYDVNAMFYRTALSVLDQYLRKNKEHGYVDTELEKRIKELQGTPNDLGGVVEVVRLEDSLEYMNFKDLMQSRHSIREFAETEIDLDRIKDALDIAQYTPSACNRQGWNIYIIQEKEKIEKVLKNQNGNRGFGEKINKLLLITFDLRYSSRDREVFQAFIDGGMYSANILNSLFYKGIGTIPLSASLSEEQERNIRNILEMDEAEVFVLFVGLGQYPEKCLTTRSERRPARCKII